VGNRGTQDSCKPRLTWDVKTVGALCIRAALRASVGARWGIFKNQASRVNEMDDDVRYVLERSGAVVGSGVVDFVERAAQRRSQRCVTGSTTRLYRPRHLKNFPLRSLDYDLSVLREFGSS
jgi:predicted ThiF/HesA family dinucleotide-utilizing enzyme